MLQNVTGEIEGKPNRTKTAPKQTEKRGQRAGKKRDTRKLSQRVNAFPVGPGGLDAVAGVVRARAAGKSRRGKTHPGRERKGDAYAQ